MLNDTVSSDKNEAACSSRKTEKSCHITPIFQLAALLTSSDGTIS